MLKLIKKIIKELFFRPRLAEIGQNSFILLPRKITNKKFVKIGRDCQIGRSLVLEPITSHGAQRFNPNIIIGNDVYIGRYCQIFSIDSVVIEDGCVLSEYIYISDSAHGFDPDGGLIMQQDLVSKGPIHIGKNSFLGYGVSLMPGVSLGKNCVVGINSVVTRSFPDFSMIAGTPAKLIKTYCVDRKQWINVQQ